MKYKSNFTLLVSFFISSFIYPQYIEVTTVIKNINASGGVTIGPGGNIYVSDFGPALGKISDTIATSVYKILPGNRQQSTFLKGFKGASGSCFDSKGNFYQSDPRSHTVTKRSVDGKINREWATGLSTPIGIAVDKNDNVFVCNCAGKSIQKITPGGLSTVFVKNESLLNCPNGLTIDPSGNLYTCNFNDGKVLKITPAGELTVLAELPALTGGPNPVGNGHLTWKNNYLFVVTIGRGELYRVSMTGETELIAGIPLAYTNNDGDAKTATFCKPNGIAASVTGDTLYINVSDAPWNKNPLGLHPAHLRMITGICSLPGMNCSISPGDTLPKYIGNRKDIDRILENIKKFSGYYMAADYDKLAASYTIDGKIFPNNAAIIEGREAIKKRWILPANVKVLHHASIPREIRVENNYAYDYGYYEGRTRQANGNVVSFKGKYVIVWRKENDDWKIYLDIWNRVE